jgi:hypothetical protein
MGVSMIKIFTVGTVLGNPAKVKVSEATCGGKRTKVNRMSF